MLGVCRRLSAAAAAAADATSCGAGVLRRRRLRLLLLVVAARRSILGLVVCLFALAQRFERTCALRLALWRFLSSAAAEPKPLKTCTQSLASCCCNRATARETTRRERKGQMQPCRKTVSSRASTNTLPALTCCAPQLWASRCRHAGSPILRDTELDRAAAAPPALCSIAARSERRMPDPRML